MIYDDIIALSVQDRAALSVAKHLGVGEVESWDMHDADKVGQSAIGELVRSKGKQPVNPFPQGVKLVTKNHNLAKHFSISAKNRMKLEKAIAASSDENLPTKKLKVDHNNTRAAA